MALPFPEPGQVIRYRYLWHAEARRGMEEGLKDRPCAVVLAVQQTPNAARVIVAPITHSEPSESGVGIELPAAVKRRLGLDDAPSWIITDDVNVFVWPGPDLRPISPNRPGEYLYGYLPAKLTRRVLDSVRYHAELGTLSQVPRSG